MQSLTAKARSGAILIAIVAGVTLALRLYIAVGVNGGIWAALSAMSQFFTILTNFLVFLMMLWIALGWKIRSSVILSLSISITCVGLVFHILLAHLVSLNGLELWADHGTHTFVPILTCLWWVLFAPVPAFRATEVFAWIVWPLTYCAYALIRAEFSGFYPYPFLNLPEIGAARLCANVAGLIAVFIAVGLIMRTVSGLIRRHA